MKAPSRARRQSGAGRRPPRFQSDRQHSRTTRGGAVAGSEPAARDPARHRAESQRGKPKSSQAARLFYGMSFSHKNLIDTRASPEPIVQAHACDSSERSFVVVGVLACAPSRRAPHVAQPQSQAGDMALTGGFVAYRPWSTRCSPWQRQRSAGRASSVREHDQESTVESQRSRCSARSTTIAGRGWRRSRSASASAAIRAPPLFMGSGVASRQHASVTGGVAIGPRQRRCPRDGG
jgi:hypothetical protein